MCKVILVKSELVFIIKKMDIVRHIFCIHVIFTIILFFNLKECPAVLEIEPHRVQSPADASNRRIYGPCWFNDVAGFFVFSQ